MAEKSSKQINHNFLNEIKTEKQALEWSLVLQAMGVEHTIFSVDNYWKIEVNVSDSSFAETQIWLYENEINGIKPIKDFLPQVESLSSFIIPFIMIIFHLFISRYATESNWFEKGIAAVDLISGGEWWRVVTALTLHGGLVHLFSNLIIGSVVVSSLFNMAGVGFAWFLVLLSGISGNIINALVQPDGFRSLGASTAVFGAFGVVGGIALLSKKIKDKSWTPFVGSLILLALMGAGRGSDLSGHLFGFGSGVVLGIIGKLTVLRSGIPQGWQSFIYGFISWAVIVVSWYFAFN